MTEIDNYSYTFGNTLVVGAGPAAVQVAVHVSRGWCDKLGLVNRTGAHTVRLKQELAENQSTLTAKIQSAKHSHLSGEAVVDHFYEGFDGIDDIWQTLILCTPSDSYKDVVNALQIDSLTQVKTIILISSSIGSNALVTSQLTTLQNRIDVINFSTYYAATKFASRESVLDVFTKAFKKRVYIASNQTESTTVLEVQRWMGNLGIKCTVLAHPLEAESRSITTYVHPPFFLNDFSLDEILSEADSKKSMYKLYPEGPITQHAIRAMLNLWKEVSDVMQHFGAKPFNLLQFLNDDNYPVHELTLSRDDIENFMEHDPIKQEYLLYIRYSAILIDPFSTPDEQGKYFEFSAVPYKKMYQDQHGKWVIPRIPLEDYKKLKLLYGLAHKTNVAMPQTLQLLQLFEQRVEAFVAEKGRAAVDPDIFADTTQEDVDAIFHELRRGK